MTNFSYPYVASQNVWPLAVCWWTGRCLVPAWYVFPRGFLGREKLGTSAISKSRFLFWSSKSRVFFWYSNSKKDWQLRDFGKANVEGRWYWVTMRRFKFQLIRFWRELIRFWGWTSTDFLFVAWSDIDLASNLKEQNTKAIQWLMFFLLTIFHCCSFIKCCAIALHRICELPILSTSYRKGCWHPQYPPWKNTPGESRRIGPFLMLFIGLATLHDHADLLQGGGGFHQPLNGLKTTWFFQGLSNVSLMQLFHLNQW